MLELEKNGFYPLTRDHLNLAVPSRPGVYMLAVQLPNGVHHTFFTSQSDNLFRSLRVFISRDTSKIPPLVLEHLEKFQCYFSFFVIIDSDYRQEVEKMLTHTIDPVVRLRVVNCN